MSLPELARSSRDRPSSSAEGDDVFVFPTSFAQRRLWFLDQLEPGSPFYNIPMAVRFAGGVQVDAVRAAVQAIVDRHESLRTTFAAIDGQPMQVVAPGLRLSLPAIDVTGQPDPEGELMRRLGEQAQRPFNLATGPLLRAELLRLGPDDYVLLLAMHHIVSDGWSTSVLMRELSVLYSAFVRGAPSPLPPLPVQYADFAVWQHGSLQGAALETHLGYWKRQLNGAPAILELPADRPRPPAQAFRGATHSFRVPAEVARGLRALGVQEGATLFMSLLAGFYALLHRYTGQSDLVVGTPIANRLRAELAALIGFFVNTLVLRVGCPGHLPYRVLLRRVREVTLDAYDHQDMPFDRLVEELQPERALSHNPLFQVMFMLQTDPSAGDPRGGAGAPPEAGPQVGSGTAKFDLILAMVETGDDLLGAIEYRTDMFDADRIARMAEHFGQLLQGAAGAPDTRVDELPLLSPRAEQRLVEVSEGARVDYPPVPIPEAFALQAARYPGAVAVEYGEERVTYGELQAQANRLARYLRRLGVGPGTVAGVCMGRSADMTTAMLAVLSAGGAYVPLDAAYPRERLAYMVEDAKLALVLAHEAHLPVLPAGLARVVCLDSDERALIAREPADPLPPFSRPDDLAYVIYPSGSTGRPKGSAVTHRGVVRLVHRGTLVPFSPEDRVGQLSNASFDPSVFEIWGALLGGGRLVGLTLDPTSSPSELAQQIQAHRISVLFVTTAVFNYLAREAPDVFAGVGTLVFGGEAADPGAVAAVLSAGPPRRLVNGYGPTECSVFSTYHEITAPPAPNESVPIGVPVSNGQVYVLDRRLQLSPLGIPGEIYIGGDGVGDRYFRRPALTAQRFVPDPFSTRPGRRLYRTGDLGRRRSDGRIEYLGRMDGQVKIRGYRIELGEVEETLRRQAAVREAAVLALYDVPGGRLAAFVVPEEGAWVDPDELRRFVQGQLPQYMVPATYISLPGLPLTPNGKVDRGALAAVEEGRSSTGPAFLAPRTRTEAAIAEIWAQVLGRAQVGVHDDFFHLGGHSLLATQVMSRIRRVLGVDLALRRLFETPTVAGLAGLVESTSGGRAIDPGPRRGEGPRDRLTLSFAQERLWFLDQLQPGNTAYNVHGAFRFEPPALLAALRSTLAEIVRRHETLRTTFTKIDGRPVQAVAPPAPPFLRVIDLTAYAPAERMAQASRLQAEEAGAPFDLEQGPLFRALLLRLGTEDLLAVSMHHIVSDGWSMGLFAREVQALYEAFFRGAASPLPELPIQYADFAAWQRDHLSRETLDGLLRYWRGRLEGAPALLSLPTDRQRPPMQTFQGAVLSTHLPRPVLERLQTLSSAEGATLFMTLLAAFAVLLRRWSGEGDIVVGSPIANRTRPEIEGLIGFFVNTVVLRLDLSGDPTFRQLLARVREVTLEVYAHQDLPFEKLVEELQPERNLSHTPLFQVMFVLQNLPTMDLPAPPVGPPPSLPSARAPLTTGPIRSKFDLTLAAMEDRWGLGLSFEHNTDLFHTATIQRLAGWLEVLLDAAGREPDRRISALPLLAPEERARLVVAENATERDYGPFRAIHQLIEDQALRSPDATAVACDGEPLLLSYRELLAGADKVSQALLRRGVQPDTVVAVCLERSSDLMVALLGVLRAGATYLPVDLDYPEDRVRFFLSDSGVQVVLTSTRWQERVPPSDAEVVCVDALGAEGEAPPRPLPAVDPDHLAYVIYTSGSTGRPKGAMNTHGAIANRLCWMQEEMSLEAGEGVVQKTPTSFDVSVWELFWPLCVGATVVLAAPGGHRDPVYLRDLVIRTGVTTIHFVPSLLRHFLEVPGLERCTSLSRVVCSGEPLTSDLADRLLDTLPVRLYNLYGPTEAAVDVTCSLVGRDRRAGSAMPIGRPIANTQIHLLDEGGEPVPVGVAGHLHIGGVGLARGYLARPGLTAERFVPDPFSPWPGARLYRSGDIAVRRADGQIEFLGRADQQVKLRGFRIELGEIEAALREHPALENAVVDLSPFGPHESRLVAYVVPHAQRAYAQRALAHLEAAGEPRGASRTEWGGEREVFPRNQGETELGEALRAHLAKRLPEPLWPASFVVLDRLPLTPSGKVDRRALPAPEALAGAPREYVAPRDAREAVLAAIWAEVLGRERVGIHDDFFALGGHSLLATQVVSRIRSRLQVEVPLRAVFESPTVAGLRPLLDQFADPAHRDALGPILKAPAREGEGAGLDVSRLSDEEVSALVRELLAEGEARA